MRGVSLLAGALLLSGAAQAAVRPVAPETVSARLTGSNRASWVSGYEAEVTGDAVVVRVGIHLIPAGVTRPELERVLPAWEAGIRRLWSGRFALELASGERLPIVIEPRFRGPIFHHEVVVRPGTRWADQLDWGLGNTPETVAHEFGHMLGAFDDYPRGANARAVFEADPESVMTSLPGPQVRARARHLEAVQQWFAAATGAAAGLVELAGAESAGEPAPSHSQVRGDARSASCCSSSLARSE